MRFIYFANGDYIKEKFDNSDNFVKLIEELGNNLSESDFIIYGGNYNLKNLTLDLESNNKIKTESCTDIFIKKIRTFEKKLSKIMMFGSWDMDKLNFPKLLNFYSSKTNSDFEIPNGVSWNHIQDTQTLLITFDSNLFEYDKPEEILVSTTPFKDIFSDFTQDFDKENNQTIQNLIDYQFNEISSIVWKKNKSIKNIIFITQYPLAQPVYANESSQSSKSSQSFESGLEIKNKQFIQWLSNYSLELRNVNLYYLAGSSNYYGYSYADINVTKQSDSNIINLINLTQYIVGTGGANLLEKTILPEQIDKLQIDKLQIDKLQIDKLKLETIIEIKSEFTEELYQVNLKWTSIDKENFLGYIICNIEHKNLMDDIYFTKIDINNSKDIEMLQIKKEFKNTYINKKPLELEEIISIPEKINNEIEDLDKITTYTKYEKKIHDEQLIQEKPVQAYIEPEQIIQEKLEQDEFGQNKQIQLGKKQIKTIELSKPDNKKSKQKPKPKPKPKPNYKIDEKFLSNIEISGSESDENGIDSNQENNSDPEDPYRQKYIKYKNKLEKLREKKQQKNKK